MNRSRNDLRFHGDTLAGPGQLDFAVNVAPGSPPDWLREALQDGLSQAAAYPNEGPATIALAARHGRPADEVVLLNGSAEAFWLLAQVLRPELAVVVQPSFTEPEAALRAAGHRVQRAWRDPDRFGLDPAVVPADADLVVTGNPNNPTGTLDPAAAIAAWAQSAGHAAPLVQELTATRERLAAALAALPGVRVWPSAANFLLLHVPDGSGIFNGLATRGIAVRPCHNFPGLTVNYLRVAVRDPVDNQRLIDAFREALG